MIPMKTSTIFKNRWMALIWAAGILWFAWDFAGAQPQDGNGSGNAAASTDQSGATVTSDDQRKLAEELNGF